MTTETKLTDQPLDALIPAPIGPWRKLAVSVILIALAIGFTIANFSGILYPRPFATVGPGTWGELTVNTERDAVGVFISIPNFSDREVRLTDVTFDAPGAELVDVIFTTDIDTDRAGQALPVTVPIDSDSQLNQGIWVFFQPTSCVDPTSEWGFTEVTVDFGAGGFPPISRTYRVEDAVWDEGRNSATIRAPGLRTVTGDGPLSLACEVLR